MSALRSQVMKNNAYVKEVTWRKTFREHGYELRREVINGSEFGCPDFKITSAYTLNGDYIGNSHTAHFLCVTYGIKPELNSKKHCVCSIGRGKDGKWYGWSHRAFCGFKVGDKLFEEGFGSNLPEEERDKILFVKHGKKTIKNLKEAKLAASRFAKSVS